MNLLSLVHNMSEGQITVMSLATMIVDAIDNDSSVPIDEWDMTGKMRFDTSASTARDVEIVSNVALLVSEWGYQVIAKTESGSTAQWVITMSIASGPHETPPVNAYDYSEVPAMHDAVERMVDAEAALANYLLNENDIPNLIDSPGSKHAYLEDLFNAMCVVVCADAAQSGNDQIVAALGCGPVCEPSEDETDDDPRCVCGVYRSEHTLCGCPEGFQTAASWNSELRQIRKDAAFDASGFDPFDDETDDQYYQSQGQYYCKHGVYTGSPGGADYMCGRCEMGDD